MVELKQTSFLYKNKKTEHHDGACTIFLINLLWFSWLLQPLVTNSMLHHSTKRYNINHTDHIYNTLQVYPSVVFAVVLTMVLCRTYNCNLVSIIHHRSLSGSWKNRISQIFTCFIPKVIVLPLELPNRICAFAYVGSEITLL